MKNNILAILSLLMIASCSIQSSQYNFIKNIALNEENNRPEKIGLVDGLIKILICMRLTLRIK